MSAKPPRSFTGDLTYSRQVRPRLLDEILLHRIPGATHIQIASTSDDYAGTDYWVHRLDSDAYSIDLKLRKKDYGDLTLEIWSKMPTDTFKGCKGWTLDAAKDTDFILWYWENTGRFLLMPFAPLWHVFTTYGREWLQIARRNNNSKECGVRENIEKTYENGQLWRSQCLFVREEMVLAKMNLWARGTVKGGGK